jgi:hypothetical protein
MVCRTVLFWRFSGLGRLVEVALKITKLRVGKECIIDIISFALSYAVT